MFTAPTAHLRCLSQFLGRTKKESDLMQALDDLMTENEIAKLIERLKIIDSLNRGRSQRAVRKESGASMTTVVRGSSILRKKGAVLPKLVHEAATSRSWWQLLWRA